MRLLLAPLLPWLGTALLGGVLLLAGCGGGPREAAWSDAEIRLLESLSIDALGPPPADPSNRFADDPRAAALGHALFFDPSLSGNGEVACATCHVPALLFTDGRPTSHGMGPTSRNAPTLLGVARSPWQFWDGRRDSLWAQALAPIETGAEMGSTRTAVVRRLLLDPERAATYQEVFGPLPPGAPPGSWPETAGPFGTPAEQDAWYRLPARERKRIDRAFANLGKAIAAYERQLRPGPSRFDLYVRSLRDGGDASDADASLSELELRGLRLFVDAERTLCLRCHNGPLLTNHAFHHVGTAEGSAGVPDFGRFLGVQAVLIDPFNCLGPFSDAPPTECRELRFLDRSHLGDEMGKFKTPTLRGLPRTGPYLHDGRFATLEEVIEHYRTPPPDPEGALEITPLELEPEEVRALAAFLRTLDGGLAGDASGALALLSFAPWKGGEP